MNEQQIITAFGIGGWNYCRPQHENVKMQLLTTGGVCVIGQWTGDIGEHYLAWAPLLKRDKAEERRILARYRKRLTERQIAAKLMGVGANG